MIPSKDELKILMLEAQIKGKKKSISAEKALDDLRESLENYIILSENKDEEFASLLKTIYGRLYSRKVDFGKISERARNAYKVKIG
jgi:hypothetical protein